MLNMNPNGRGRKAEKPEDRFRVSDTDFRKQLRWLMNEGGTVCVTITPEMAAIILELNSDNRPLSPAHVSHLSEQMVEGKWVYTKEPIIISDEGRLIDGQHRLEACLKAGVEIMVDVAFNAPDKAFSFINLGKKRTSSDIFSIRGVQNFALMAAATRWVVGYERGTLGTKGLNDGRKLTPDEAYQAYTQHLGLQQSAWVGHRMNASGTRIIEPSVVTAFHYLCAKKDRELSNVFYAKIAEGFGWQTRVDPAFKLHQRLTKNLTETLRFTPLHKAAFLVKAWNAERQGKKVDAFRLYAGEHFPEIK